MKRKTFKKLINGTIGMCAFVTIVGMVGYMETRAYEENRIEHGRYYDGIIVTNNGFKASYTEASLYDARLCTDGSVMFTEIEHELENDVPVYVRICDKGTPNDTSDDEILKAGLDWNKYMDEIIARNDAFIASLKTNGK